MEKKQIEEAIAEAQLELDGYKVQMDKAINQLNFKLGILLGKVEGLKALLEPKPEPEKEKKEK